MWRWWPLHTKILRFFIYRNQGFISKNVWKKPYDMGFSKLNTKSKLVQLWHEKFQNLGFSFQSCKKSIFANLMDTRFSSSRAMKLIQSASCSWVLCKDRAQSVCTRRCQTFQKLKKKKYLSEISDGNTMFMKNITLWNFRNINHFASEVIFCRRNFWRQQILDFSKVLPESLFLILQNPRQYNFYRLIKNNARCQIHRMNGMSAMWNSVRKSRSP